MFPRCVGVGAAMWYVMSGGGVRCSNGLVVR